jgi:alkanesulfonate monooxygenase SsuD/methylene tetrahydromethanopterin reductase-like flavin-dependent oxidoreductase (luciferase family)
MKAGFFNSSVGQGERVPIETVYERALQQIEIVGGSGYDAAWLTEHHFLRARRLAPRFGLFTCLLDSRSEVSP